MSEEGMMSVMAMTKEKYDALVEAEGGTFAAWESVGEMVEEYRAANPDDDRDLLDLIQAGVFNA